MFLLHPQHLQAEAVSIVIPARLIHSRLCTSATYLLLVATVGAVEVDRLSKNFFYSSKNFKFLDIFQSSPCLSSLAGFILSKETPSF